MNDMTLPQALIETCRRQPSDLALADSSGARVTFGEALTKSVFLAGRLRGIWSGQDKVGIMVPPSVGGALVNWAALLMGKVPVNLNYTLSREGLISCLEQCGITDLVVSGRLMERLKLDLPVRLHRIEDLVARPRWTEKLRALVLPRALSCRRLLKRLGGDGVRAEDLATVIFSSGSTGDPKGVMLSHRNLVSNVRQVGQRYSFVPEDRMLGVLPFFHSFGFMATIAGPAMSGFGCLYHHQPMESKVIGPLAREHGATIMIATPTFLQFYLRGIAPEQLETLRLVVVGAEKLQPGITQAFGERFGCSPVEAYGCTECAPGIAVNGVSDNRLGSIGRLLPEMEARIVDPDTGEELPEGEAGLLLVRGPNVMMGYLGSREKTAEVLKEGWYDTGDLVRRDEEGYLWIEGRQSRFSKIGGEMVPHGRIEEVLQELGGGSERLFAVTGVGDERKGERLVVIHTADDDLLDRVMEGLAGAPLPNLWKPRRAQFLRVPELPLLGSGKLDLKKLTAWASAAGDDSIDHRRKEKPDKM